MASLRASDALDRPFCGGTLIHPRVVLTAAHVSLTAQQPQDSRTIVGALPACECVKAAALLHGAGAVGQSSG